jgi:small conductance mechanosensitive channel
MNIGVEELNLKTAWHILSEKLGEWATDFIRIIPNLIIAVAVITAFSYVAKFAHKITEQLLNRVSNNKVINQLAAVLVHLLFIGVGIFIALGVLNLDKTVTSLLTGAGIITLALGFSFQDIASNIFAGILIAFRRPYRAGDLVEVNGNFGLVQRVELRMTMIQSPDGIDILIPNKDMLTQVLKNYTLTPGRRLSVKVGVAYGSDLTLVEKLTLQALENAPYRLKNKPIEFYFTEFGASSINFEAQIWVEYNVDTKTYAVHDHAIRNIWKLFQQNHISIPFPVTTLDLPKNFLKN